VTQSSAGTIREVKLGSAITARGLQRKRSAPNDRSIVAKKQKTTKSTPKQRSKVKPKKLFSKNLKEKKTN